MYKLSHIKIDNLEYLDIESPNQTSKLKLCLNQGGRIAGLNFNTIEIISEVDPLTYKDNYASAILFPFANRINNGTYTFNTKKYNLACNQIDENNAIHGLVYKEKFVYESSNLTSDLGTITLKHKNYDRVEGFPFAYEIRLTYTLSPLGINLVVSIDNKDESAFPFTVGWHPYFSTTALESSSISFNSTTKFLTTAKKIISGHTPLTQKMPFLLKNVKLDDSYKLENNALEFSTPEYDLRLNSSSKENFLQLFIPNQPNSIAIEPMTGVCDSFNNKIGLQMLQPHTNYKIEWNLAIKT